MRFLFPPKSRAKTDGKIDKNDLKSLIHLTKCVAQVVQNSSLLFSTLRHPPHHDVWGAKLLEPLNPTRWIEKCISVSLFNDRRHLAHITLQTFALCSSLNYASPLRHLYSDWLKFTSSLFWFVHGNSVDSFVRGKFTRWKIFIRSVFLFLVG